MRGRAVAGARLGRQQRGGRGVLGPRAPARLRRLLLGRRSAAVLVLQCRRTVVAVLEEAVRRPVLDERRPHAAAYRAAQPPQPHARCGAFGFAITFSSAGCSRRFLRHPHASPISCPLLLPTHSPAAAISAAHLFDCRALEKNNKHIAGSIAQGRTYLPPRRLHQPHLVGGIGPPEANHYLDTLFSDSYASELAASGSTRNTAHARRLFYQSLLATLTKATADMTSALTIAAFDASTADAPSAAGSAASPPNSAPLDANSDHSDDAEF